jgi:hypothetical protein
MPLSRGRQSDAGTMAAPVTVRSVTGMNGHRFSTTQPTAGQPTPPARLPAPAAEPATQASPAAVPAGGEAVISVRDLRIRYGQHEALAGLSFEVRRGELGRAHRSPVPL